MVPIHYDDVTTWPKAFQELHDSLPPIVERKEGSRRYGLPYAPGSLANEDSRGTGPSERILLGSRRVAYPRKALVAWLLEKATIEPRKSRQVPEAA